MKNIMMMNVAVVMVCGFMGASARADGDRTQGKESKFLAERLGKLSLQCVSSGGDKIKINVNQEGEREGGLKMIAKYPGYTLNTDKEGFGEECGGLTVKDSGTSITLEDMYDDCERGQFGYHVSFAKAAFNFLESGQKISGTSVEYSFGGISSNAQTILCTVL